ncbi:MAG: hypothetical protein Aurels2KO_33140 [Aureliella sp.]
MQRAIYSRRRVFSIRGGRAAVGALIAIALLVVIAGSASYFLAKRPQVIDPAQPVADSGADEIAGESDSNIAEDKAAKDQDEELEAPEAVATEMSQPPAVVDPEEQKRLDRIADIKAGNWTNRRIVALTAAGPYVIDFRTGIDGKSLEEAERENLEAIADQLLAPPEPKSTPAMMSMSNSSGSGNTDANSTEATSTEGNDSETADDARGDMEEAASEGEDGAAKDAGGDEAGLEIAWQDLLDRPLVSAGWLGNLIAEDDQRDQLISMYDRQRDDVVSRDELRDFLSRGLSRRSSVQLADIGNSPDARDASPWGPFDLNEDYVLDKDEASKLLQRFEELDADDDDAITLAESRPASMQSMAMADSTMVLSAKTLYITDPSDSDATELEQLRKFGNLAARVIEHYTFLAELPAEKWPGYPASRWSEMDKDESGGIDRYEMRRLFQLPADINIFLRFDSNREAGFVVHAEMNPSEESETQLAGDAPRESDPTAAESGDRGFAWTETPSGGRLTIQGLSLQINIEDLFSPTIRSTVDQQIQSAIEDEQLAENLRTRFQLGEEALELVDSNADGELDSAESDRLWQWLTARQSTRVAGRWMLAPEPWFQLLDRNADARISQQEVSGFVEQFDSMFEGDEASLGGGDPLLAQFTVRRADPRLENAPSMSPQDPANDQPTVPQDWFAAMDLNDDGSIDDSEFLGDLDDFLDLDVNKDGYLRRSELYVP